MIEKVVKRLNLVYYLFYVAALLVAAGGFQLYRSGVSLDSASQAGIAVNSALIIYIIGSIPIALSIFNKKTKIWAELPSLREKLRMYEKGATLRILVIGSGFLLGILFFFLMNSQSMIFCAGIAAIGLFFCKPAEVKIISELKIEDPEQND
jgi:hypothetical protein